MFICWGWWSNIPRCWSILLVHSGAAASWRVANLPHAWRRVSCFKWGGEREREFVIKEMQRGTKEGNCCSARKWQFNLLQSPSIKKRQIFFFWENNTKVSFMVNPIIWIAKKMEERFVNNRVFFCQILAQSLLPTLYFIWFDCLTCGFLGSFCLKVSARFYPTVLVTFLPSSQLSWCTRAQLWPTGSHRSEC